MPYSAKLSMTLDLLTEFFSTETSSHLIQCCLKRPFEKWTVIRIEHTHSIFKDHPLQPRILTIVSAVCTQYTMYVGIKESTDAKCMIQLDCTDPQTSSSLCCS